MDFLLESDTKKIKSDFVVYSDKYGGNIVVPKGFCFNGASIPKPVRMIFGQPFDRQNFIPGLVHDYLYDGGSTYNYPLSRKQADAIFRELLIKEGVCSCKACVMWATVRVFGFYFYKKHNPIPIGHQLPMMYNIPRPLPQPDNRVESIYYNYTPCPPKTTNFIYPTQFELPSAVFRSPYSPVIF